MATESRLRGEQMDETRASRTVKGWARVHFEGIGEVRFEAGSCMYQQPSIHHRVLEYSDDYTVIEITMPADFETVTVAP